MSQAAEYERALQASQRGAQQEVLARLANELLTVGDLDVALTDSSRLVADALRVARVAVFELLPGGEELVLRAEVGWPRDSATQPVIVPTGMGSQPGFTLLSSGPVMLTDARTESRFAVTRGADRMSCAISVIIGEARRPFGVLLAGSGSPHMFTPDDVTFLQVVANVLALTIQRHNAHDLRRQLLARVITAQEDERRRVARDLHDQIGQSLSALLVGLRSAEDATTLDDARQVLKRLREVAGEATRDVGRIARGLRPSVLDDLGLVAAIRRLGEDLEANGGATVWVQSELTARLAPLVETTLYRVVQEALTNVLRHARARAVTITLSADARSAQVIVRDDGVGFDVAAALASRRHAALGLAGMQERAALVGGTTRLESAPGTGTTVTARLPLEP